MNRTVTTIGTATLLAVVLLLPASPARTTSVIVQGASLVAAADAVRDVGGIVTRELGIIDGVEADIADERLSALRGHPAVLAVHENRSVELAGKPPKGDTPDPAEKFLDTAYPLLVGANRLHDLGVTGRGVTVAVLDTGFWPIGELEKDARGRTRVLQKHVATGEKGAFAFEDHSGHASHVTSVILSSGVGSDGRFNGVAPDASLVVVKAFDDQGRGSYGSVIDGLDFILANHRKLGIRVANLSFSAPAVSFYWEDPLNQAVMALWEAGIVVVASAGNSGPDPMTVGVPGNLPYVITVGAMTDNYTPTDGSDDLLASFSACGPTVEGFVKPEVVAPGGHLLGLMEPSWATIAQEHPEFHDGWKGFRMSGTSQATAVASGVVALLLQWEPSLTPDMVKCKLMSGARPAVKSDGTLAYSVFQQGAGMIDAWDSAMNFVYDCANRGLDVDLDLVGAEHYGGRADRDSSGVYFLRGLDGDGYSWSEAYMRSGGYTFTDGYAFTDAYAWSDAFMFTDGYIWSDVNSNAFVFTDAYAWSDAFLFADGYPWSAGLAEPASINVWVPQE